MSFSSSSLNILTKLSHELPKIELVVSQSWSGVRAGMMSRRLHTKRLNMNARWLWPIYVSPLAKRCYLIYAYDLNEPSKAQKMAKYGVAGIITDRADRF